MIPVALNYELTKEDIREEQQLQKKNLFFLLA